MLFNSVSFAIFLPVVFAMHWLLPHRFRWILLLVASCYFYMSWNPKYIILIASTIVVSYLAAILIEKKTDKVRKKWIVAGTVVYCLGILFFFKYFNFFEDTLASIAGLFSIELHPVTLDLLLPVGISFYTFQTLSYVFDVYAGKVKAERHFGLYATFISFFPQLVAGPIERTSNLLPQIRKERKFNYDMAIYGARLILWGFFKKIAVADILSVYVDRAYNDLTVCTSLDLCIAILFFTIQIYCDFSGYSDIAVGTARLFGITITQNFKAPYFSTSIREFWSRWHITLSSWFRDYVYIPLGGNRCSRVKNHFNVLVTFLLSGLWHGANWTFVAWGGATGCRRYLRISLFQRKKVKDCLERLLNGLSYLFFAILPGCFFDQKVSMMLCM